jgi:hypothetical protein
MTTESDPAAVVGDRANIEYAAGGFDLSRIRAGRADHRKPGTANAYDAAHFRARVLQDALAEGLSIYWERRAQTFLNARPRAGDFRGNSSAEQLAASDRRLVATAQACRYRASLGLGADDNELVDQVLVEMAA